MEKVFDIEQLNQKFFTCNHIYIYMKQIINYIKIFDFHILRKICSYLDLLLPTLITQ